MYQGPDPGLHAVVAPPLFPSTRLPPILQTEAVECGLACLALAASCLGYRTDLSTLRGRFPISLNGTSMVNLAEYARRLHLSHAPPSRWRNCHNSRPPLSCTGI
ncbi:hypothetical protein CR152_26790 [Massilia violaceinigra]|uniref:Peptidase C39 domain-containing protein n=1 Tax=Massilia violaceinigra TaxID=2045208 RepID=A0A2D2DRV3_9BURK|nr:hypothetical protein CR152_26790 [Massilia violaceinigra]